MIYQKRVTTFAFFMFSLFLISSCSALYIEENSTVDFGHVLRVENISTPRLAPGQQGALKVTLKNNGDYPVTDTRIRLILPNQLQLIDDVNEVRIAEIKKSEKKNIEFKIIALPNSEEGIYNANLTANYVTHFGVNSFNVGQNSADSYNFGIIVRSDPSLFVQIDSSTIYSEKKLGNIILKFVNNGTSNIKFLTVDLQSSEDYEIITDSKSYIGDLDSDDYQTITYKIKINGKNEETIFPVKITFRDSINNIYLQTFNLNFKIRNGAEIGESNNRSLWIIFILAIITFIFVIFGYKKYLRNKNKKN